MVVLDPFCMLSIRLLIFCLVCLILGFAGACVSRLRIVVVFVVNLCLFA